jgi:hypothetical protein
VGFDLGSCRGCERSESRWVFECLGCGLAFSLQFLALLAVRLEWLGAGWPAAVQAVAAAWRVGEAWRKRYARIQNMLDLMSGIPSAVRVGPFEPSEAMLPMEVDGAGVYPSLLPCADLIEFRWFESCGV